MKALELSCLDVFADDLSGAAEIAGAALRHGLQPQLLLDGQPAAPGIEGVCVYDTDSRLLTPDSAAEKVRGIVAAAARGARCFKKIDSLMRGPVLAEIDAALQALKIDTALLVPQNPSRGRCIVRGTYFVNDIELHQTEFRNDPDAPRWTSDVRALLGQSHREVVALEPGKPIVPGRINLGCGATIDDISAWAATVTERVLPVGAVDFFTAVLERAGCVARARPATFTKGPRFIVSGSASAYAKGLPTLAASYGLHAFSVAQLLRDASDRCVSVLCDQLIDAIRRDGSAVLSVGADESLAPQVAKRVQDTIAACAERVQQATGAHLFVDGGATAAAVLRHLGWRELEVCSELATGVVELRAANAASVTIKPGSYAWPDVVWTNPTSSDPIRRTR